LAMLSSQPLAVSYRQSATNSQPSEDPTSGQGSLKAGC
jgi:hypothetical protein